MLLISDAVEAFLRSFGGLDGPSVLLQIKKNIDTSYELEHSMQLCDASSDGMVMSSHQQN